MQFNRHVYQTHYIRVGALVSLFSADREHWLPTAQAYRNAAKTITKYLPDKHGVILVIGDIFSKTPWSNECPYPMNDPHKVLELCRISKKARSDILVAIPAGLLQQPPSGKHSNIICAVADDVEVLEKLIAKSKSAATCPAANSKDIAFITTDNFFRRSFAQCGDKKALPEFLNRVEKERLAVTQPAPLLIGKCAEYKVSEQEKTEGFVPLFDGRSFDGWTTLQPDWGNWCIHDGTIHCKGGYGPWLRTRKRYKSFVLRYDYKISKRGNSGVFVWASIDARCSTMGMEFQIFDRPNRKIDAHSTGSIYAVQAPKEDPSNPPGQWNSVEITCKGSTFKAKINGKLVQDFDADKIPKLKDRLREGVIGLQDHGNPVWFRNIRIMELPSQ
jgi:hypothetical protein